MTSNQSFTWTCTNQITNWLVHSWSIFVVRTSRGQTSTHKTHHNLDLGEATTFPLIVYYVLGHKISTQMAFCPEIPKIGTLATLGAYNFVYKPPIEMRSNAKLQPFSRSFQQYVACHLHIRKLGRFLTFIGQESNCQFYFWPFFQP